MQRSNGGDLDDHTGAKIARYVILFWQAIAGHHIVCRSIASPV